MSIDPETSDVTNSPINHDLQKDLLHIMKEHEKLQSTNVSLCTEDDLEVLKKDMPYGPENYHDRALQDQIDGKSKYLIVRKGDQLVGHGNLLLNGPKEVEVVEVLAGVPEISAMEIKTEFRSQGLGTEIITAAEQIAQSLGKTEICIGVSEQNPRARELYEKLGYTDRGLPKHKVTQGENNFECVYLVKKLSKN